MKKGIEEIIEDYAIDIADLLTYIRNNKNNIYDDFDTVSKSFEKVLNNKAKMLGDELPVKHVIALHILCTHAIAKLLSENLEKVSITDVLVYLTKVSLATITVVEEISKEAKAN